VNTKEIKTILYSFKADIKLFFEYFRPNLDIFSDYDSTGFPRYLINTNYLVRRHTLIKIEFVYPYQEHSNVQIIYNYIPGCISCDFLDWKDLNNYIKPGTLISFGNNDRWDKHCTYASVIAKTKEHLGDNYVITKISEEDEYYKMYIVENKFLMTKSAVSIKSNQSLMS
jgi:hypothetical protein